jgi:hypothetical protein
MNIPDHFSESSETVFRDKNTLIILCGSGIRNLFDPGSGIRVEKFGSGIRDKHPESATLACNSQYFPTDTEVLN